MSKQYSIAEARHNLAAIIHEVEQLAAVELTRRGAPVAILLSIQEYHKLTNKETGFWDAYSTFLQQVDLTELDLDMGIFDHVRDSAPGREVDL